MTRKPKVMDRSLYANKLREEYEAIKKTLFWEDMNVRITDERMVASRHCETDHEIAKYQGSIEAFDFILRRLVKDILDLKPRKSLRTEES